MSKTQKSSIPPPSISTVQKGVSKLDIDSEEEIAIK